MSFPCTLLLGTALRHWSGRLVFSARPGRPVWPAGLRALGNERPSTASAWRNGTCRTISPLPTLHLLRQGLRIGQVHPGKQAGPELAAAATAPVEGQIPSPIPPSSPGEKVTFPVVVCPRRASWPAHAMRGTCVGVFVQLPHLGAHTTLGLAHLGDWLATSWGEAHLALIWAGNLALVAWTRRCLRAEANSAWIKSVLWRAQ